MRYFNFSPATFCSNLQKKIFSKDFFCYRFQQGQKPRPFFVKNTPPVFCKKHTPPVNNDQVTSRCSSTTHYWANFVYFQNLYFKPDHSLWGLHTNKYELLCTPHSLFAHPTPCLHTPLPVCTPPAHPYSGTRLFSGFRVGLGLKTETRTQIPEKIRF